MSMADLLAKQQTPQIKFFRGDEIEGKIILITDKEVILDLGTKAEGVIPKKEFPEQELNNLKVGGKLKAFVIHPEGEGGQVVLGVLKPVNRQTGGRSRSSGLPADKLRWFEAALKSKEVLKGRGVELNKGGLVVELNGINAFLPTSQMSMSSASKLEDLVGEDLEVVVIEIDPAQNRLILTQKQRASEETKKNLAKINPSDVVYGEVVAVLPFGVFVLLENNLEGFIHVSEISWEKIEDPNTVFKVHDQVEAKVLSKDVELGRVNLSVKQLSDDPFSKIAEEYMPDDVIKATVLRVTPQGVFFSLKDGVEAFMPAGKQDPDTQYEAGKVINVLVDSVDSQKRRVNVVPFVTSTKDLIYK